MNWNGLIFIAIGFAFLFGLRFMAFIKYLFWKEEQDKLSQHVKQGNVLARIRMAQATLHLSFWEPFGNRDTLTVAGVIIIVLGICFLFSS